MKWTCIDVRTYNENNNGTKTFGKLTVKFHFLYLKPCESVLKFKIKLLKLYKNNEAKARDPLKRRSVRLHTLFRP